MALLGLGPRMLLVAVSQLLFQAGAVAEFPLGAVAEFPLGMRPAATRAKRQRLISVAGLGGISDTALVTVLAAVREEPELLDDNVNRKGIERALDDVWRSVGVADELELDTGGACTWLHARPSVVLNYLLATCLGFSRSSASMLQASPCTPYAPWRIVL